MFALKGNRLITHVKKPENTGDLLKSFYGLADLLEEKLGPILFQLPPSMKKNPELLAGFLQESDKDYENVVEFRHKSWYCKETYDLLREYSAGYCIVSAPNLPCEIKVTSNIAYIRWHGTTSWYSYNYTKKNLECWAREIKKLEKKCEKIYAYFNNDYNAYAVKNCKQLKNLLA